MTTSTFDKYITYWPGETYSTTNITWPNVTTSTVTTSYDRWMNKNSTSFGPLNYYYSFKKEEPKKNLSEKEFESVLFGEK